MNTTDTATEFLGCRMIGASIAVPVHSVQEVFTTPRITRVPGCPEFIAGMVNVRGSIIPVLNLHGTDAEEHKTVKIVILGSADGLVGLLVSDILDLIRFESISPALQKPEGLLEWADCFTHSGFTDVSYFVLNVEKLIAGTISRIDEAEKLL